MRGHGETVLVVDDELPVLLAVQHCLQGHGYRVLTAKDGREALATFVAEQRDIRLVVTDLMMPVMDGATLARQIHQYSSAVPIVASSGLEVARRDLPDIAEFLSKPYDAATLLAAAARLIHQPST